jgi:hypothetical protein
MSHKTMALHGLLDGQLYFILYLCPSNDRLCGLVVKVPGYRSRALGSIPSATRFSEK